MGLTIYCSLGTVQKENYSNVFRSQLDRFRNQRLPIIYASNINLNLAAGKRRCVVKLLWGDLLWSFGRHEKKKKTFRVDTTWRSMWEHSCKRHYDSLEIYKNSILQLETPWWSWSPKWSLPRNVGLWWVYDPRLNWVPFLMSRLECGLARPRRNHNKVQKGYGSVFVFRKEMRAPPIES